jgi:SAM-dependent methyltransferase
MSFWPLPTTLVEGLVAASRRGPLVELGCGEGRFARRLRELGLETIGLDRRRPGPEGGVDFVNGDLMHPPFARESVAGFILANALRHVPVPAWPQVGSELHDAARPGGLAVVLEDDPVPRSRPEENYRKAVMLLAAMSPERGGPVSAQTCLDAWRERWGPPRWQGLQTNEEPVHDPLAPLRWLQARTEGRRQKAALARLRAQVEQHGMQYGRYWCCIFAKEAAGR